MGGILQAPRLRLQAPAGARAHRWKARLRPLRRADRARGSDSRPQGVISGICYTVYMGTIQPRPAVAGPSGRSAAVAFSVRSGDVVGSNPTVLTNFLALRLG